MFLYLEDILSNAFIEVFENDVAKSLPFSTIIDYGYQVVRELEGKGINATLVVYNDKIAQFKKDYEDVFEFYSHEGVTQVKVRQGITTEYLRKNFRAHQEVDPVLAMVNERSREVLGIQKKLVG